MTNSRRRMCKNDKNLINNDVIYGGTMKRPAVFNRMYGPPWDRVFHEVLLVAVSQILLSKGPNSSRVGSAWTNYQASPFSISSFVLNSSLALVPWFQVLSTVTDICQMESALKIKYIAQKAVKLYNFSKIALWLQNNYMIYPMNG